MLYLVDKNNLDYHGCHFSFSWNNGSLQTTPSGHTLWEQKSMNNFSISNGDQPMKVTVESAMDNNDLNYKKNTAKTFKNVYFLCVTGGTNLILFCDKERSKSNIIGIPLVYSLDVNGQVETKSKEKKRDLNVQYTNQGIATYYDYKPIRMTDETLFFSYQANRKERKELHVSLNNVFIYWEEDSDAM